MRILLKELLTQILKTFIFTKYTTPKKILNLLSISIQNFLKTKVVRGYPIKLNLDPTPNCNLKCFLCPTGMGDKSRSRRFMKFSDFKKIVDEIGEYIFQVDLFIWGEPFLNKEITKMISYAHKKRVRTRISTNLNVVPDGYPESIIESGLDELIVTIAGIKEETHKIYAQGSSFSNLVENIKILVKKKEEMKRKNPEVILRFLVMRHNEHEIPKLRSFAKELKVKFELKLTRAYMGYEVTRSDKEKIELYSDWFPKQKKYQRFDLKKCKRRMKFRSCAFLWTHFVVNWDCSVSPCCGVYNQKHDFGNAKEGVLKVWNNEKFKRAREMIKKRKIIYTDIVCSNCLKYGFFTV